jgi:dTDP-4-amino-4,6-dideoxygalactose transaminase
VQRVAANDFARQWEEVGADALAAMDRVGRSGRLVLGEELRGFEAELAAWWGTAHAIGVASGLDALEIALRCAGVAPGDRVLTTPLTAFATTLAILRAGAEPVWCDVDESGAMDLDAAAGALARDGAIRAVLPVHLYGHPIDPSRLEALAAAHDVVLVEDCAQCAGARRDGRPTGTAGRVSATSLYPTKNLGAMGDGGAVTTDDADVAEVVRSLRHHGSEPDDANRHVRAGWTARLDNLQAALLRLKLPHLEGWNRQRREAAERYHEALDDLEGVTLPPPDPEQGAQVFHLFVVELDERDRVLARLREDGIGAAVHYPTPVHLQPAWSHLGEPGDFPAAERLAQRALTLPAFPGITPAEVDRVAKALRTAVAAAMA